MQASLPPASPPQRRWLQPSTRIFWGLYCLFLAWIVAHYRDYGISWDESFYLDWGGFYYWYSNFFSDYSAISQRIPEFHQVTHGALIDVLYYLPLRLLKAYQNYEALHLVKACFASLSLIGVFWTMAALNRSRRAALIAVLLLISFPRWLGDIFDNHMDISAAWLYSLMLWAGVRLLQAHHSRALWGWSLALAVLGAIGFSHRVSLILGLALLLPLFFWKMRQQGQSKQALFIVLVALFWAYGVLVLVDPYIRHHGLLGIFRKLQESSHLSTIDFSVLFAGERIPVQQLPFWYLPQWLFLTIPPVTLFLGLLGSGVLVYQAKKGKTAKDSLGQIWLVLAFWGPLLIACGVRPAIFDGWRHFLLLSIPAVMLAAQGFETLWTSPHPLRKRAAFWLLLIHMISTVWTMKQLHPYQYLYFNGLASGLPGAEGRYETDYWGKSFKEAITWLKTHEAKDSQRVYFIKVCGNPTASTYYFPPNFQFTEVLNEADYFICYTKNQEHLQVEDRHTLFRVQRQGVSLNYVKRVPRLTDPNSKP